MSIPECMKTSNTDDWATPQDLFDRLNDEFNFSLDPCASDANHKCGIYYTKEDNGLSKDWWNCGSVFMNPPYGRKIGLWVKKAWDESQKGATVVCLLPARTDTKWWHDYCMKGEIRFLRGRLYFNDGNGRAPFPSAVVIFRHKEVLG